MTDIETKVARALREHGEFEGISTWSCSCGLELQDTSDHADHVAAVVVEALGLYEERRTNAMSSAGMTTNYLTGETTYHSDIRHDRRWVSRWVTEEKS